MRRCGAAGFRRAGRRFRQGAAGCVSNRPLSVRARRDPGVSESAAMLCPAILAPVVSLPSWPDGNSCCQHLSRQRVASMLSPLPTTSISPIRSHDGLQRRSTGQPRLGVSQPIIQLDTQLRGPGGTRTATLSRGISYRIDPGARYADDDPALRTRSAHGLRSVHYLTARTGSNGRPSGLACWSSQRWCWRPRGAARRATAGWRRR
jgi:hypothetical protein